MNTSETHTVREAMSEVFSSEAGGRSIAEAVGAMAAVILAVIGLAGTLPILLASVVTIVIGAGVLLEGWAAGTMFRRIAGPVAAAASGVRGTLTAEFLGGVAGIILGILALFQPEQMTLLSVALLVYGATLLLSGLAGSRGFGTIGFFYQGGNETGAGTVVAAVPSGQLLVGFGTLVLGILAVIGLAPMTLILVGLLSLAVGMLLAQLRLP